MFTPRGKVFYGQFERLQGLQIGLLLGISDDYLGQLNLASTRLQVEAIFLNAIAPRSLSECDIAVERVVGKGGFDAGIFQPLRGTCDRQPVPTPRHGIAFSLQRLRFASRCERLRSALPI
jgi:hypothetical protein